MVRTRLLPIATLATALVIAACKAQADAPTVSIAYPISGMSISTTSTTSIRFQASVSDLDEAILSISYYICPAVGTSCSSQYVLAAVGYVAPFDGLWIPPPSFAQTATSQQYLVYAQAQNVLGQARVSVTVPFTLIQPPDQPKVALVFPSVATDFLLPAAPILFATASPGMTAPPSTIQRVDFLDGGDIVGTVSTSNTLPAGYAFLWRDPPPGVHLISARATDSLGYSRSTSQVSVVVADAEDPPQVRLTQPAAGALYAPGAVVPLNAMATSSSGSIERVEFLEGQTIVATVRSEPYTANWVDPPPGTYAIVARAYDDVGVASTSPAAYIQVMDGPRLPLVVLTAPAANSTVSAQAPLSLAATALSPDGAIAQVDFYADTGLLGSATTSPYVFSWPNPQVGSRGLYAKVRDVNGRTGTSASISISVTSALVPTVSLTAPLANVMFAAPPSIRISANAAESGGTIAKVEFYADGNLVGTRTSAPYSVSWANPAAGGHTLSAKATDGSGKTATSASIAITVYPPPPTINVSSPVAGAHYSLGDTIVITAQVTTPGSTITKIDFVADGSTIATNTAVPGFSTGTFTLNWSSAGPGVHVLSARVYAATGATTQSSAVNVTVADIALALLEPHFGQVFQTSAPIALLANASESTSHITRVEFYADGTRVATSNAAPYAATWNGAAAGSHSIIAKAFDANGLSTTSLPTTVTVVASSTIQFDAGIEGATIGDDNATISGVIQAPLNSAISVNGQPAVLDLQGRFFVENVKLQMGANPLTVILNTQGAAPVIKGLTISSTGIAPFDVSLDKQQGLAPLAVNLSINDRGNIPFKRITIDTTDNGTPDIVLAGLPPGGAVQPITYGTPGLYTLRVVVYDAHDKPIYTATRRVRAIDPNEIGYRLASVYTTMVNSLAVNDTTGALTAFVDGARDRYASVFSALAASLPAVAGQLGTLTHIVVMEDVGELTVTRQVGSDARAFMLYLIRGSDGIWRIETM
jgi:sulfur relay (sulfurtransferase) complex TusBCD TusD component (DsrE family)